MPDRNVHDELDPSTIRNLLLERATEHGDGNRRRLIEAITQIYTARMSDEHAEDDTDLEQEEVLLEEIVEAVRTLEDRVSQLEDWASALSNARARRSRARPRTPMESSDERKKR